MYVAEDSFKELLKVPLKKPRGGQLAAIFLKLFKTDFTVKTPKIFNCFEC